MATKKDKENAPSEMLKPECRCEESRDKTLLEMIRIILKDLAFWKKDR